MLTGWEVNGTSSRMCPMMGVGNSSAECSGYTNKALVRIYSQSRYNSLHFKHDSNFKFS